MREKGEMFTLPGDIGGRAGGRSRGARFEGGTSRIGAVGRVVFGPS